jgi:hypothetical protein
LDTIVGHPQYWYDVNGDDFVTPNDALRIINQLNRDAGEGEGKASALVIDELMRSSAFRIHRPERASQAAAAIANSRIQPAFDKTRYWQQVDEAFRTHGRNGHQRAKLNDDQTIEEELDWWKFLDEELLPLSD